jgi:hypothetical protein
VGCNRNTKITKQKTLVVSNEDVLWLNVAVDMFPKMRILERWCNLVDISDNGHEWNGYPFGVLLA